MIQKLLQTNYRNKALDTTVIKRNCDKSQEAKSTNFYCTRFQKDIFETELIKENSTVLTQAIIINNAI